MQEENRKVTLLGSGKIRQWLKEVIEINNGTVFINGTALEEPYIAEAPNYNMGARKIPEGEYFVLGDNRNNSNDSHTGWTLPQENIIGNAWISIWPVEEWGLVPNHYFTEEP